LKAAPELPSEGTIWRLSASDDGRVGYVEYTDVGQPFTVLRLDPETGELTPFRDIVLPFVAKDVVTERCFYAGEDGTRIPIFVSRSRKTQAGPDTPTLLYAYGGFGVSETPQFTLLHRAWIDMGGQLAVACIRGGNEYGEPWREAGVGKNRMTCYKDFCRAAEWLVEEGYTSTDKLVINGRSNGGLLVGACMTMRPELFGAAVPAVGVHDMLRFHKFTVGRYWVSDFGSPDDPEVFPVLLGYSPVHNVRSGTAYPPTLVLTADHDDRVFPAHSYKFGAALQHAQSGDAPILVRIDHRAGHGFGRSIQQEQAEIADVLSFLVDVLGFQPRLDCEASD